MTLPNLGWGPFLVITDGGRKTAGCNTTKNDCVTRAIAIATQLPYSTVAELIDRTAQCERPGAKHRKGRRSSARTGVFIATIRKVMDSLDWEWVPTMFVGQGCKVHLRANELPSGRLVVNLSKHLTAVIDGVVYDTHDPSRNGTRCVYGYWRERK